MKTLTPDSINSSHSTVNISGKHVVLHKKEANISSLHHDTKILPTIQKTKNDDKTKALDYTQSRSIYLSSKKKERRIQNEIMNGK